MPLNDTHEMQHNALSPWMASLSARGWAATTEAGKAWQPRPVEGEELCGWNGAVALKEDGGCGLSVLLPAECYSEGEGIDDLKLPHPAEPTGNYVSSHMSHCDKRLQGQGTHWGRHQT